MKEEIPIIDLLPKGEGYGDPDEKIGDEVDESDNELDDLEHEDIYLK